MKVTSLKVLHNGALVGKLIDAGDGTIAFHYSPDWLASGFSISPFSLPLEDKTFVCKKQTFGGLYGVFWDTLPDGWGELLIKRALAKNGVDYDRLTPLTKLSIISRNGLGGLTYEPADPVVVTSREMTFDELSYEANLVLNNAGGDLDTIFALGGGSGGARPKAHLDIDGEEWIVKFPCSIDPEDVGIKEFSANEKAKECGININEYRLFPSSICSGYYGAKRFDRAGGKRVHVISLAAILETTHRIPNLDYQHLFQVIRAICPDPEDTYEAFRRACFYVLYGNKDDHSKNFAFVYDEKDNFYRLSPAFDVTRTDYKAEHEMTVNGNGKPTVEDLVALAETFSLSKKRYKEILDKVISVCQE